jgi:hypothetical protein
MLVWPPGTTPALRATFKFKRVIRPALYIHVTIDLDTHLERSGLTLIELASRVGITLVNLSVLKTIAPGRSAFRRSRRCAKNWTASRETS